MLKALNNFGCTFVDEMDIKHFLEFKEGDLINDPRITRYVLSLGCPVASVVDTTTVVCPRCSTQFDSTQYPVDATITLVNAAIPHEGQFFSFDAGQIVEHSWLIETLKTADVPLETIRAIQCPNAKCGHVFTKENHHAR